MKDRKWWQPGARPRETRLGPSWHAPKGEPEIVLIPYTVNGVRTLKAMPRRHQ